MKHIGRHLSTRQHVLRMTERGELMKYFCLQLNHQRNRDGLALINMARMGKMLEGIPTKDLYYIKRVCGEAENFSKKFWYVLNPEKYEDGAKKRQRKEEKDDNKKSL